MQLIAAILDIPSAPTAPKSLSARARVRELGLIDKERSRARAVATDMHYGVPLSPLVAIKDGDYDDLEGAGLVIIAAGD
jgi:L-lactate dehydrogenase